MKNTNLIHAVISSLKDKDLSLAASLLDYAIAKANEEEDAKTIDDYIKEGWVVKRKNESSGKEEWCLVDHEGKKTKSGEKRNLKWFGSKKPDVKEVKERIAEIKFFKSQK